MKTIIKMTAGLAAAAALGAGHAQASTWIIDYTANNAGDTPYSAVVNVVASDVLNSVNGYDVLSVTGNVDGDTITGLVDNPNQPFASLSADGLFIFDNVVWPGAAEQLSNPGIFFNGASGHEYNLFSDDPVNYELYKATPGRGFDANSHGTIAMEQTFVSFDQVGGGIPEPATWGLMILGFGAVGATLRRRRASAAATPA